MIKRLLKFLRQSLPARLSLSVVLFAILIFLVVFGFMFRQSRVTVRNEAFSRAEQVLDNTVQRVNTILDRVETASENLAWLIPRHLDAPDSMFMYSRRLLEVNPELNGCSIAFEPYFFKGKGKYFSAYSLRTGDVIETTQEGNDHYDYFSMDWYQLVKLLDRPGWTEPFSDYNPDDIYSPEMIASYCMPIKDGKGTYVGTLSVDLSLGWLSETISAVKPYPNSYSIMTGLGGTFFVHPDSTKLFYQTIFTETLDHEDPDRLALGYAMQRGEEGRIRMKINDEDCYVFYKPLGDTGWSAAIVCPERDIFSGYNRLQRIVLYLMLIGMLLMLFVVGRIISKELNPLSQLTHQIEVISNGELDKQLPDNKREDELGRLYQSFSHMQQSLVSYIDKMQQTTAAKAAIENELKVASDIQMSMVPRIFPAFPNRKDIDLFASMTPAKEVGGDLYDFFEQNDRMYFCIGDVSGKGVPASLFMAVTRNLFRIIAQQGRTPVEIAREINLFVSKDNNQNMFVTMFIGMVDLNTGVMEYCNCGHNPPILASEDGKPAYMTIQHFNTPLGIWDEATFEGDRVDNIRGRQLLLYTDGLTEAENPKAELLGEEAVLETVTAMGTGASSLDVINRLKEVVEKHRQGISPNDDLTLLCFRVL